MDQENQLEQDSAKEQKAEEPKVIEQTGQMSEVSGAQEPVPAPEKPSESPQVPEQPVPEQEEKKVEEKSEAQPDEKAPKPIKVKAATIKKSASKKSASPVSTTLQELSKSKQWYVVHTLSGQENKVKEVMESQLQSEDMVDQIFEVLIPTENVSEVKSGKKTVTTRKFFPGYVLVNMILSDETWHFVRNCTGVIGFIGTGTPVPLMPHEVDEIISQIEEKKEKVKPKVMFDVGENVKVNDGPFVNFTGSVEEVNPDRGKLKVVVSIFGRATPIELEYWQVERA